MRCGATCAVLLVCATVAFGGVTIPPGCLPPDTPNNPHPNTNLWCPGDNGYMCYKIPSLLRIPNSSTLLGFIEARKHSCADDGDHVDLLLRRSHDMGRTWLPPQLVYGNSSDAGNGTQPAGVPREWHTIGDALPVYDRVNGWIHLIFTRDNKDAYYTRSEDAGATWAEPRNITASAVVTRGKFCGTGHAAGLQLPSGRLLVPMYGCGIHSFVLASDDHGATWNRLGQLDASPNEWVMAPVSAGSTRLLGSLRSFPSRLQTYSDDGGETWAPTKHVSNLPEPVSGCEGAVILHPNGKLYYSHPDEHILRNVMNIKVSEDMGQTWKQHVTLWGPGYGCDKPCVPAASYSSMTVLGEDADSDIGIIYMRNNITILIFEGTPSFTTFKP